MIMILEVSLLLLALNSSCDQQLLTSGSQSTPRGHGLKSRTHRPALKPLVLEIRAWTCTIDLDAEIKTF